MTFWEQTTATAVGDLIGLAIIATVAYLIHRTKENRR